MPRNAAVCTSVWSTRPVERSTTWTPCSRYPFSSTSTFRPSGESVIASGIEPRSAEVPAGSSERPVGSRRGESSDDEPGDDPGPPRWHAAISTNDATAAAHEREETCTRTSNEGRLWQVVETGRLNVRSHTTHNDHARGTGAGLARAATRAHRRCSPQVQAGQARG